VVSLGLQATPPMLERTQAPAIALRAQRLSVRLSLLVWLSVAGAPSSARGVGMQPLAASLVFVLALILVSCGGADSAAPAPATSAPTSAQAPAPTAVGAAVGAAIPEIIDITNAAQFDAEIAKARPGAVLVVDFHAEWCGPCKKLAPDLVALATAHPGKLYVLKVDIDQQPQLAERFQVESIPLLVKFKDGKESERSLGYPGKEKLTAWLGIP
jgi:thioredoxin